MLHEQKKPNYKRKVRSYYKRFGLHAWVELSKIYPITREQYETILSELKWHRPKPGKSGLKKYGRYDLMMKYVNEYHQTGNVGALEKAQALRSRLSEPYRVKIVKLGKVQERTYPATWSYRIIEEIVTAANNTATWEQFFEAENEITRYVF